MFNFNYSSTFSDSYNFLKAVPGLENSIFEPFVVSCNFTVDQSRKNKSADTGMDKKINRKLTGQRGGKCVQMKD